MTDDELVDWAKKARKIAGKVDTQLWDMIDSAERHAKGEKHIFDRDQLVYMIQNDEHYILHARPHRTHDTIQ